MLELLLKSSLSYLFQNDKKKNIVLSKDDDYTYSDDEGSEHENDSDSEYELNEQHTSLSVLDKNIAFIKKNFNASENNESTVQKQNIFINLAKQYLKQNPSQDIAKELLDLYKSTPDLSKHFSCFELSSTKDEIEFTGDHTTEPSPCD